MKRVQKMKTRGDICFFKTKQRKEDFIVISLSLDSPFTAEKYHRGASVKVRWGASKRGLATRKVRLRLLGFIWLIVVSLCF